TANTQYCFTVSAYDNAGNQSAQTASSCATTLDVAPAAPSALTATAISPSQINLAWTDNSNNETSFKIERATALAGPFSQIATATAGSTSYQNTSLSASTTYYYRVRASNAVGDSAYTATANATTPAAPDTTAPSIPTGLAATAASSSQVNLSWTAS